MMAKDAQMILVFCSIKNHLPPSSDLSVQTDICDSPVL